MKLCINCKYYCLTKFSKTPTCIHRKNVRIDLVDGKESLRYSPSMLRNDSWWGHNDVFCGKSGVWFEPKT